MDNKIQPKLEGFFFHDFANAYIPNILEEIYKHKVYLPFVQGKKDLVIADWGGNIGLTSYYFKDFGKVYTVEPSVMHQEALETMITYNGITNITLCKYAISGSNGTMKLYHNPNVTAYTLKDVIAADKRDYEEVETVTAEEFMKRNNLDHIDLLKFDCEGAESEILTSDGFRNIAKNIEIIVGEWHNWTTMTQDQFKMAFEELGFEFTWYRNTEAQVFRAIRI